MIRQVIDIYAKLLRGIFVLVLGAAALAGQIVSIKAAAKNSVVRGLVLIPLISK